MDKDQQKKLKEKFGDTLVNGLSPEWENWMSEFYKLILKGAFSIKPNGKMCKDNPNAPWMFSIDEEDYDRFMAQSNLLWKEYESWKKNWKGKDKKEFDKLKAEWLEKIEECDSRFTKELFND